jgi:hypothetical protein
LPSDKGLVFVSEYRFDIWFVLGSGTAFSAQIDREEVVEKGGSVEVPGILGSLAAEVDMLYKELNARPLRGEFETRVVSEDELAVRNSEMLDLVEV